MNLKNCFIHGIALSLILTACAQQEPHDHAKMLEDEQRSNTIDTSLSVVVLSPAHTVLSSQSVIKPVISAASAEYISEGYVSLDPTRNEKIAARVDGRIEKLYVRYNLQYVMKGEKIMDLYSPELKTAEEEYLFIQNSGRDTALLRIAEEKLFLLGLTVAQFNQLNATKQVTATTTFYSPYEGYVQLDETVYGANESRPDQQMNRGMGQMPSDGENKDAINSQGIIREGGYVVKGQTLFVMNDFRKVWVLLYSNDASFQAGTAIKLTSEEWKDSIIDATIDFVEPTYSGGQKFASYRVYLDNPDQGLLVNSLVTAKIQSAKKQILELPASCVLSLGNRKIAWVKTGQTEGGSNIFEVREVITRNLPDGKIEIITGLTSDDEVAVSAGFLIDSQSLIQTE